MIIFQNIENSNYCSSHILNMAIGIEIFIIRMLKETQLFALTNCLSDINAIYFDDPRAFLIHKTAKVNYLHCPSYKKLNKLLDLVD